MSFAEFWEDMMRNLGGRGQFRLFLQPAMAILLGIRLGFADAKAGHAPFFLRLFHGSGQRGSLLKQTLRDAAIPLCVALAVDAVLQFLTLPRVRPLGLLFVAVLLVWLPFTLSRAFSNRLWHHLPRGRHRVQPH
jgi:hypothetical protein